MLNALHEFGPVTTEKLNSRGVLNNETTAVHAHGKDTQVPSHEGHGRL
jgi:hypothetical protein